MAKKITLVVPKNIEQQLDKLSEYYNTSYSQIFFKGIECYSWFTKQKQEDFKIFALKEKDPLIIERELVIV
jgi:hypothetical protein